MKFIGNGGHAAVVRELLAVCGIDSEAYEDVAFIAVGDNAARKREALARGDELRICARLIHPFAWVSPSAIIGSGTVVMAGAIIQAHARIGVNCIINTGATVDHHCVIGDYVHIGPGAHLCGNVRVGEGTLVGVGVGIVPGAEIPPWSLVKARRLEIGQANEVETEESGVLTGISAQVLSQAQQENQRGAASQIRGKEE